MPRSLRSHLTYANVMATIAVFLGLGGVSYAATQLPSNSVGTKQLQRAAVTKTKLDPKLRSLLSSGLRGAAPAGYGFFWANRPERVPSGSGVRFRGGSVTDGATVKYDQDTGQVTLVQSGVYDVRYSVLAKEAGGYFSLKRNDAETIPGSGRAGAEPDLLRHDNRAYDGEVVFRADGGDTLRLVNASPISLLVTGGAMTDDRGATASLTIFRIA